MIKGLLLNVVAQYVTVDTTEFRMIPLALLCEDRL